MTYTLTAADYVYLDKAETRYMEVKEFIAVHRPVTDIDRKGIPGTLKALNERVQTLCGGRQYTMAAAAIESKVRAAYKVKASAP